jgi:hypothetical protein
MENLIESQGGANPAVDGVEEARSLALAVGTYKPRDDPAVSVPNVPRRLERTRRRV